jgi:hypothetical protein
MGSIFMSRKAMAVKEKQSMKYMDHLAPRSVVTNLRLSSHKAAMTNSHKAKTTAGLTEVRETYFHINAAFIRRKSMRVMGVESKEFLDFGFEGVESL